MKVINALILLDSYLAQTNSKRSFIICGGADLIFQGIISRTTRDIDVVATPIDTILENADISVANDLSLDSHRLNMGPTAIMIDLKKGWEKRVHVVFSANNLIVYSLAREDIIFSKFWALCDRQKDLEDLILLRPSLEEHQRCGIIY